MGISVDEAVERGFISREQAEQIKRESQSSPLVTGRSKRRKNNRQVADAIAFCPIDGKLPQEKLWRACARRWPEWVRNGQLVWEHRRFVPGRQYELDIAFPRARLGIEVDGWEHHGKFKSGFQRDRQKDRAAVLSGWQILRFFAGEIHEDPDALTDEIAIALEALSEKDVPRAEIERLVKKSVARIGAAKLD